MQEWVLFVSSLFQCKAILGSSCICIQMKILQPTELSCLKLVVDAIDKQLGGRLQRMNSTTHVVHVLKYISERYLWLPCEHEDHSSLSLAF